MDNEDKDVVDFAIDEFASKAGVAVVRSEVEITACTPRLDELVDELVPPILDELVHIELVAGFLK